MIPRSLFIGVLIGLIFGLGMWVHKKSQPAEPVILKTETVLKKRYFVVSYVIDGSFGDAIVGWNGFPSRKDLQDSLIGNSKSVAIICITELTESDYNLYSKP